MDDRLIDDISKYDIEVFEEEKERVQENIKAPKEELIELFKGLNADKDTELLKEFRKFVETIENGGELSEQDCIKCYSKVKISPNIVQLCDDRLTTIDDALKEVNDQYDEEFREFKKDITDEGKKDAFVSMTEKLKKVFEKFENFSPMPKEKDAETSPEDTSRAEKRKKFEHYKEQVQELMKQQQKKLAANKGDLTFTGITNNTLALRDFIVNRTMPEETSEKKDSDYKLEKDDFKSSLLMDGAVSIDFEKLMNKRDNLIEWIEDNEALKGKEDYDTRNKLLNKLNNYLKLYCEANGVDFETGELLCETAEERYKSRMQTASLYLKYALSDINSTYFPEEDIEADNYEAWTQKDLTENVLGSAAEKAEKEIVEPESKNEITIAAAFVKEQVKKEAALKEFEAKKRRGNLQAKTGLKIGSIQAKGVFMAGLGKIENQETEQKSATLGLLAEVGVTTSALSAEFEAKYEKKLLGLNTGVSAKAGLTLGEASANAKVQASLLDANGKLNPSIEAQAGAELALLKLEAAVGTKLMGVGVEAQFGFMVGLAAKFNLSFTDWKLSLDAGAALGFGFSFNITLDFGEVMKKVTNLARSVHTTVTNFVKEKLCRAGLWGRRDQWYQYMMADIAKLDQLLEKEDQQTLDDAVEKDRIERMKQDEAERLARRTAQA